MKPRSDPGYTRRIASELVTTATRAGLLPEQAEAALLLGARMTAHGFTGADIDHMILRHYADAADQERRRTT